MANFGFGEQSRAEDGALSLPAAFSLRRRQQLQQPAASPTLGPEKHVSRSLLAAVVAAAAAAARPAGGALVGPAQLAATWPLLEPLGRLPQEQG